MTITPKDYDYGFSGPLCQIRLDHPESSLGIDEDELWTKIEEFLKKGKYCYVFGDPSNEGGPASWEGIIIWLPQPEIQSTYPEKDKEIAKISDLGVFLFDDLKLKRNCLHFTLVELFLNGDGEFEETDHTVNDLVFKELTGIDPPTGSQMIDLDGFLTLIGYRGHRRLKPRKKDKQL
jgi:hypothetical protein